MKLKLLSERGGDIKQVSPDSFLRSLREIMTQTPIGQCKVEVIRRIINEADVEG